MLLILDKKQVTVGAANNLSPLALPYFDDWHEESLDGIDTYTFMVPSEHEDAALLETRGHIIFTDADGQNRLYTIKEIIDTYHDFNKPAKQVFCESTAITELLGDIVRPQTISQADAKLAIRTILQNANVGWQVGDIEDTYSTNVVIEEYMTVMEALRKLADEQYFKDLYFTVELRGTEIVKKLVNLREDRGDDIGTRFDYKIDVRGTSRTEDGSQLATALVGLGKADSNGKRLTLQGLGAFTDGDIYKLAGTDWIGNEEAFQHFAIDGNHIFGIHIDEQADTLEKLKRSTIKALNKRSLPDFHYSASIENLAIMSSEYSSKQVRLGDWVVITDWTFDPPIVIKGKVMKIERSYTDPSQDKVDLGRYKKIEISMPANVRKLQEKINQNEEKWNTKLYKTEIVSTAGNTFKNGKGTTVLKALLYYDNFETDLDGTGFRYKWFKYNKDGQLYPSWGGNTDFRLGKAITVTDADVQEKATFHVLIEEIAT